MSVYNSLKAFLKEHEDFIKSEGYSIKQMFKFIKDKLVDPNKALKVLEKKYAKYVKRQHDLMNIEEEFNNYNIDEVNNELNNNIDKIYDQIITDNIPEPIKNELNENSTSNIKLIERTDINEKTIEIWFKRGSKTLFKDIKQTIINKINELKTLEAVYFQVFYKTEGQIRATTYSLNNNIGFEKVINLLEGDTFEMINNYTDNNNDNLIIDCSDTNKDNTNRLTSDMITGIRITRKKI